MLSKQFIMETKMNVDGENFTEECYGQLEKSKE